MRAIGQSIFANINASFRSRGYFYEEIGKAFSYEYASVAMDKIGNKIFIDALRRRGKYGKYIS